MLMFRRGDRLPVSTLFALLAAHSARLFRDVVSPSTGQFQLGQCPVLFLIALLVLVVLHLSSPATHFVVG